MGMEKLAKNKTAPGRYALLDELRGLDLVSMIWCSCSVCR